MFVIAHVYIDEKGPQESFKISKPFNWKEKLAYGSETMHGYVANAWYISNENLSRFEKEFLTLEQGYIKKRQTSISELKGSTLLSRQFKYGVASMKEREIVFYIDLINLCFKYSAENMLFSINKMSIIVNSRLLDWVYIVDDKRLIDNPYLLMYTLIKYFDIEASHLAIEILLDQSKTARDVLTVVQKEMNSIIREQSNNRRMKAQIDEYKKIVKIIKQSKHFAKDSFNKIGFDWNKVKFAVDLWLTERRVFLNEKAETMICHLDRGIPNRYFKELNFEKVEDNCDSKEVIGIRVTDFFVAIAGSYIKNLREDNSYNPDFPDVPKRLKQEWFELNEKQFELIKLLTEFFFKGGQYSFVVDTYFDNEEFFRAFLTYIASYESFENFKRVDSEAHTKKVFILYSGFAIEKWKSSSSIVSFIRMSYGSYRDAVLEGDVRPL